MNPFSNELESMGNYGYAMKQARDKELYPSPFFDIASSYFPKNIKELFKFIKYTISTNELVNIAVDKLASYPITDLIYYKNRYDTQGFRGSNPDQLAYLTKWRDLLENDLNLKSKLKIIGKSYLGYGNAFVSLYVPFVRTLFCDKCDALHPIHGLNYKYDQSLKKFTGKCPKCNTVSSKLVDSPRKGGKDSNIIVWDPAQIDLQYHPMSDTSEIFYTMESAEVKKVIAWEDEAFISKTPLSFLESCFQKKDPGRVKFNRDGVVHMKRQFMPGLYPGWGWPLPAVILKQSFYLQLLRKANETIFEQHILPFIAIFPQASQGLDVYRQVNLGDWKGEVESQFKQWRQDPAHVGIFPIPLGQQVIGGQGKAFELIQEANNIAEAIIVGMGVPKEFIFGGMSWSASSVSIRIIENDMLNFREEMLAFPNKFLLPKLAALTNLPPVYVALQDFKMADDLQQQQLMFQMMANRVISKDTYFKDCGFDTIYSVEQELINTEIEDEIKIQEKLAQSQAKIQGASQLTMMQYQAIAGGMQAMEGRLAGTPTNPPMPPPPPPSEQLVQAHQMLAQMFSAEDMAKLMNMGSWQINQLVESGKLPPEAAQALEVIKNPPPEMAQGMPPQGMPPQGMPPQGMPPQQMMPPPPPATQALPPGMQPPPMPNPGQQGQAPMSEATGAQVTPEAPPILGDFLPDDQVAILSSIPERVIMELLRKDEKELKALGKEDQLSPLITDAVIALKSTIAENDPVNPLIKGQAKEVQARPPQIDKATLDSLVVLPVAELVRMADAQQLPLDIAAMVLSKKQQGYVPAQPTGPEAPPQGSAPQTGIPQDVLNQLLMLPPEQIQQLAATGQIPPEVADFVLRHQQVLTTAPMPAPMPQDLQQQQMPAQPMPPGQAPGGLMPPPAPAVPPEFMSPSGQPMSAKELIEAGMDPMTLLSVGYSPEDLQKAGLPPISGAASENIPADVLKVLTLLNGLTPTQANTAMSQLMRVNPDLGQRVMAKFSSVKSAMNPFDLLKSPPTINNIMGMSSDMESPWVTQPEGMQALKKLLNDFSNKRRQDESNKNNPGIKAPSETSPNKKYMG